MTNTDPYGTPRSEVDSPTGNVRSAAAAKVKGPAIGIIVVGILGALGSLAGIAQNVLGLSMMGDEEQMQQIPEWARMLAGGAGIALNALALIGSVFVLFGGLQMRKLKGRGLCIAASVVAMLPFLSGCCCVGIPIGIWALIVLSKPDVKQAFA